MPPSPPPNTLKELFAEIQHLPFLFVGSGLSRRYRGLPDWRGLLSHFAEKIHPGNPLALQVFTGAGADPDLPAAASVIEVAAFISRSKNITGDKTIEDELALLKNVSKRSVAGVITTNYDTLLESTFENYITFIGQEPLLFGETQGVAEIYKIHGCCSRPESLVLNAEDYLDFGARNAYLAAKLLTIFVDHPIIFLGYNLGDENIRSILEAIIACLGSANLGKLKQRLIFMEYTPEPLAEPIVAEHSIQFQGSSRALELTKIRMNGFLPLYRVLQSKKYQYNPRLLRQLKRDIYHLAATNEKVDRFQIADIEDDAELSKVETLVGVGVIPVEVPVEVQVVNGHGHNIPESGELFMDAVLKNGDFDVKSLVEGALPTLLKHNSGSIPICRYLAMYERQYGQVPPCLNAAKPTQLSELLSKTLIGTRRKRTAFSVRSILQDANLSDEKRLADLPMASDLETSVSALGKYLEEYLQGNRDVFRSGQPALKTNLRRMIRIYDFLKYGKGKDAHNTEEESIG